MQLQSAPPTPAGGSRLHPRGGRKRASRRPYVARWSLQWRSSCSCQGSTSHGCWGCTRCPPMAWGCKTTHADTQHTLSQLHRNWTIHKPVHPPQTHAPQHTLARSHWSALYPSARDLRAQVKQVNTAARLVSTAEMLVSTAAKLASTAVRLVSRMEKLESRKEM